MVVSLEPLNFHGFSPGLVGHSSPLDQVQGGVDYVLDHFRVVDLVKKKLKLVCLSNQSRRESPLVCTVCTSPCLNRSDKSGVEVRKSGRRIEGDLIASPGLVCSLQVMESDQVESASNHENGLSSSSEWKRCQALDAFAWPSHVWVQDQIHGSSISVNVINEVSTH